MINPHPKMQLKAFPDAQGEHVTIELWMDDKPLGHILLDGATLEDHIHKLAGHRSQLKEEVPRELDPGSRLEALVDPVWRIPGQPSEHGRVLALRHPGLGWLSFVFPEKEAAAIAEWLTRDMPQKPAPPPNP